MTHWLYSLSNRTWLWLMLATLAAFQLSDQPTLGIGVGLGALLMAYVKGRLVVLDFMEMRHAPWVWRTLLEGWLLLVTALIAGLYVLSPISGNTLLQ